MAAGSSTLKPNLKPEEKRDDVEKSWKLGDEYQFSPELPEGDPWKKILDRLLEKDKIRCDGWRDEVGNLLIFAGLFSAVVTAFVIESYQTLQPDPQTDIVSLLFQISGQLNNTGNNTAQAVSNVVDLPSQSFSPDQSAVRVNIFWFLSLIFSLATVLIGIMGLQWIREHQTYPGRSAREDVAMFQMHCKGMDDWYVWQILTALPLLLQVSLVLFFAGLIDFLNAVGNRAVLISVTTAISIILVFLFTTTTLPAVQSSLLYLVLLLPRRLKRPPSQCPYKSPQSAVISSAFFTVLRIISSTMSIFLSLCDKLSKLVGASSLNELFADITAMNFAVRCRTAELWGSKTWMEWDSSWLWVRDSCARILYDNDYDLSEDNTDNLQPMIPLLDSVAVLQESKETYNVKFTHEAYHCFSDLSSTFTTSYIAERDPKWRHDSTTLLRRNQYLRSVFRAVSNDDPAAFEDDLLWKVESAASADIIKLIHDQNIFIYLEHLTVLNPPKRYLVHREEVKIRIQQFVFTMESILPPEDSYPDCLDWVPAWTGSMGDPKAQQVVLVQQYMDVVKEFFVYISRPETSISSGRLHAHPQIGSSLRSASLYMCLITAALEENDIQGHLQATMTLAGLFDTIKECLARTSEAKRLYVLYCAAIYVQVIGGALQNNEATLPSLAAVAYKALVEEIRKHKKQIIDDPGRGPDVEIEQRFEYHGPPGEIPFTQKWWSFLHGHLVLASSSSIHSGVRDIHTGHFDGSHLATSPVTESLRPCQTDNTDSGTERIIPLDELGFDDPKGQSSPLNITSAEYTAKTSSSTPHRMPIAVHHPSTSDHIPGHYSTVLHNSNDVQMNLNPSAHSLV